MQINNPRLEIKLGNSDVVTHILKSGIQSIGRSPECAIQLKHNGVTRLHALIQGDPDGQLFIYQDLGSLNGTFLNKDKVARALLCEGDVLSIGPYTLVYRHQSDDDTIVI